MLNKIYVAAVYYTNATTKDNENNKVHRIPLHKDEGTFPHLNLELLNVSTIPNSFKGRGRMDLY